MTEPCDLDAVAARRLIGAKKLAPTELLESCIGRIEAVNHAVNAIVACDFARARAAAVVADEAIARGDALPPLHGLPLGVKDLEPTAGLRTTWGSPLFRDHVPDTDQGAVARARAAGAIVLGKTNVPEFGLGANTRNLVYGPTGNPFNPRLSAAGSSGGSAVALATGMAPLATGSDTGGSLRNPAAFCGVVGFRPTPGLVANERRSIGESGLPVLGPMARTVSDLALLLGAMAGDDGRDMLSRTSTTMVAECDLAGLRVAITEDFGFAPTAREIRATFGAKLALFRHLFGRCDIATPDCSGADEAFAVLRAVGVLAAHSAKVRDYPELCGPNLHANIEEGLRYSAADVARAFVTQTAIYQRWQAFFSDYDVILSPAITISPRPWSELYPKEIDGKPTASYFHWLALAYAVTVVGHPALSLPVGLDQAGMPFGLQIVGPRNGDAKVLAAAAALERELAGDPRTCRPRPDLEALRRAPAIANMSDPG
ncbi:amidase [Methylocapsa sp. S129]|uniref:amidase n=1 Tax=Methylocapsa sp. S129 TaxID=1641869 RepID=UPI00131D56B0|nr:amidase family protein [Methylocapsa sp. S129]